MQTSAVLPSPRNGQTGAHHLEAAGTPLIIDASGLITLAEIVDFLKGHAKGD